MKKILVIFGTRPEAIKMAPVVRTLKSSKLFEVKVAVTAQHRQMLDQVLNTFEIIPDFDLNIMAPSQSLASISTKILEGVDSILTEFKPDLALVHGDTTTAFISSLACFYRQVKIGHVEAGLRTHNIHSPFPEELNRQGISKIADFHFAPTPVSRDNLLADNISAKNIEVTGNTVIDSLLWAVQKCDENISLDTSYMISEKPFVLITSHRRENFGQGIIEISHAIKELAVKFRHYDFVFPVHLNPNIQVPVASILKGAENIYLIEPQEYMPFVKLMSKCSLILTDSGGIQEEAPSLNKIVLVMRDTTERPEAVASGAVTLVGSDRNKIVKNSELILQSLNKKKEEKNNLINPYGDGRASERILNFLISRLNEF